MRKNILVLWDIDGTLMHCGADGTTALNRTFQQLYGVENAFSKVGIGSAMDAVILDRIMNGFNIDKGELERIKKSYVENLQYILNQNVNKKVLPGIRELLNYIDESDHCFNAILTSNLRIGAETKLKSVGLHQYFQVGGFGDANGEKWDAAKIGIAEAEEYFGVKFDKERIYLVGDGAYDMEAANRLGIKSIGVATGWMAYEILETHSPDYLFRDLSNYNNVIEIWESVDQ